MPNNRSLTVTEEEVLNFIADGLTQDQIGSKMNKTRRSVEHHCNMAREKLGARTIAHAVAIGFRRGILIKED
jgi:LuxR family quorum sensing-dependent transcriptional regulator